MRLREPNPRTIFDRAHGKYRSVDDVTEPRMVKARKAERRVGEFLESNGFDDVVLGVGRGPDLTAILNGAPVSIEVKTCIKNTICDSWCIHTVSKNRRADDLIAIVLPDNTIILEPMKEHLAKCNSDGRRTVTALIRRSA